MSDLDTGLPPVAGDSNQWNTNVEITEVDLFLENCSSLYSLILDALHDLSAKTLSCQHLDEMASSLASAGWRLVAERPDTETTVALRINTINSAMEQLKLRKCTSDSDTCSSRSQPSSEIRGWIHSMERRLREHEERLEYSQRLGLTKLLADQQVLQLEIQSEGQSYINRLYQQFKSEASPDVVQRKKLGVDAIRKRWHTLYLNSLCLQCRIEETINTYKENSDSESDPEFLGPPSKRARHSSGSVKISEDEDTLPFAESEYESIMDGRATVTSVSSEEFPAKSKKWDSLQQDIGYSSGENSVHETISIDIGNNCDSDPMRRKRIDSSPVKSFYRTVQLEEMSDIEIMKAIECEFPEDHNPLTDSMHVNCESHNVTINYTEYDEIMALLDEDDLPQEKLSDSFNTKWKEIRGQQTPRKNKLSREIIEQFTKNSCDASSEESSDWDSRDEQVNIMTRSFNSAIMDSAPNSLKRQRSNRGLVNIGNLLDCSEMDVSFCSTRSELPPCKSRSIRKKLRVRRMPRSMSDGEQLGVVSGPLTPQIRVSPPSTPLANSTRLLQRLDQQLEQSSNDSDTAPEQSDVQVYEWDEYHPPAKDESIADLSVMPRSPEDLLSIDEDFGTHFGGQNTIRRLVEENRAHLQVVENSIGHGDIDAKQMSNVQMIVRANLRQLESVLRFQELQNFQEGLDLEQLRGHWTGLLERVASPVPQILNKVERFASSLRDLHVMSSVSTLNGISEIRSKDDVRIALEALCEIEEKLSSERDELRSLLSSKIFRSELSELSAEFNTISQGYDDAVERIRGLVESLKKLNLNWTEWNDQQTHIRMTMSTIEEHLRMGEFDPQAVLNEMELCQERMNNLETMCNYLTSSLQSLQDDGSDKSIPDFRSEIILYFNALKQLKSRFNDLVRVPTPPMPSTVPRSQPEIVKRRVKTQTLLTQIRPIKDAQQNQSLYKRVYVAVSTSWIIKSVLVLSLLSALAALFCAGILGSTFGPHLSYVNGPPPL